MSESTPTQNRITEAAERPKHGPQVRGHGPMAQGPAEKAINFGPSLRRLLGTLRPEMPRIWLVITLTAVAVVGNVVSPRVLGMMTDLLFAGLVGKNLPAGVPLETVVAQLRAAGQNTFADMLSGMDVTPGQGVDWAAVAQVGWIALGLAVLAGVVAWASGWILNDIVQGSVYRMRRDVQAKLDRLPLSYFDRQPRGELLSRVTNDIDNVATSLQQTLSQLLSNLLTLVGVLFMMFWVSPVLAVIALIAVPVSLVAAMTIGKRAQGRFAAMWKSTGDLNAQIEEAYTGHALVKVFGRSREVEASFKSDNDKLYEAAFGAQFISGLMMPVMMFIGNLSYVAIAVVGGIRVASGQMSLGDVQAFIQYSRMFTQPITQVASMANLLQSGVASAERVFQVLDADEQTPDAAGSLPALVRGRVEFEDVSFSYSPDKPLIEHLSLVAEPGRTVAIVGPTGAGKTTLVNLIMRFYEVDAGRILIDGVDVTTIPRATLRGEIGMVLQDTWLFGGTIRDNIAYGRPGATEEEIRAAATATYVDRFVHSLPEGYDTVIDEEGSNVSAGEKQLITIARAFLADPSILILDEATSSVDTRTELLLQRAMAALRSDRTSFVIAHRLSTIRDADVILVMENGTIVEQGNHDELLAAGGAYHRLYMSQFAGSDAEADADAALPR
ncbi:ABC transporter ATP-binding protein [Propioniciclava sp.]|uniref:ABC transporter ATP-binding protein n=1 Tax=Propioniciclava sp. TaxID=2038686 RepID=UPI002607A5B5|nr:ABC transporter ATP-binding protein [Propioniciclava sp.]